MKKILGLLAILILSVAAFGQTRYTLTVGNGTPLTGLVSGRANFTVTNAPILGVWVNGVFDTSFTTGTVTFTTGNIVSVPKQNTLVGSSFGSGGSVVIQANDLGTIFTGTFTSALWTPVFNASLTHQYYLTGSIINSAGDTGAMSLTTVTAPTVSGMYNGTETVNSAAFGFTIN